MIGGLRAGWLSFRRIHLAALIADWPRTLLSVIGVGLGVTVVLGVLILRSEVVRPFDAFGPALAHAAGKEVTEVTPNVNGRLPMTAVDRLRSQVSDVDAVIPVVAGLVPVDTGGGTHGFFVLGGTCQIELLVGPFNCERRAREERPAPGPGVPLQIPAVIAERLGLALGQELHIAGLPTGAAHLGWTFPEFDRVKNINDGYVLLAPATTTAADLLGSPGYVTAAFVLPKPGAHITADVNRVIGDVATAGPPSPQQPAVFVNIAQSFNLTAMAGVLLGFLVAANTVLLAIEDRRAVLGTIGALGARPLWLLAGLLGEGAVVGVLGGLLAVPGGFLLGMYLVDSFGRSLLVGSGAAITAHFTPGLLGIGAVIGILCGLLATAGPAIRLIRDGPLASMESVAGVTRGRRIGLWPLIVGVVLVVGSVVVLGIFGRGSLELGMGSNGMTLGLFGVAFVSAWAAPRAARPLIGLLTRVRPDIGRLLGAEIRRYVVLFALSVAVLTLGASLAIGSQSMQVLGTSQVAAQKGDLLPTSLLIAAQSVLDQRDSRIDNTVFGLIDAKADGGDVAERWRSVISSGAASRLVIGITPGDWYSQALYRPRSNSTALWQGLQDGEVGLSEVAAHRLGVGPGDTVQLPTVSGVKSYDVTGIFRPEMINDTAVGDIVLVSAKSARNDWAAVRDQVAVRYDSAAEASDHRRGFLDIGAGLSVYDDEHWRSVAGGGITRFFEPFTVTGYVVMAAAGLSVLNVFVLALVQRRRERAVLRAIGATPSQEQAVIVAHAGVLGLLVGLFGMLGGIGLTYLQSLGSPVYYGIKVNWGVPLVPLATGLGATAVLVLAAALYPVVHATRLETADVLRAG